MTWKTVGTFELDASAVAAAKARIAELGIPKGSLGRLHEIAARIAGITGSLVPALSRCQVIVFSADHGVTARGVSAFDREITDTNTRRMAEGSATISVLSDFHGASLCVVDVGIDAPPYGSEIKKAFRHEFLDLKVARGTRDIVVEAAMSPEELEAAISRGYDLVVARAKQMDVLVLGDMGIGNTTSCSALISALLNIDADLVTGLGSGIEPSRLAAKVDVVKRSVVRYRTANQSDNALTCLRELGGFEIAAIAGALIAAAEHRVPVLLDGFIVCTSFLIASRIVPGLASGAISGTRSSEPGFDIIAREVGLVPILDLGMCLGEGTGGLVSYPIVRSAVQHLSQGANMIELAKKG
jgi:nicotinate-nucleotide--dimethylbenzimidazole phosphoribosyltransferase